MRKVAAAVAREQQASELVKLYDYTLHLGVRRGGRWSRHRGNFTMGACARAQHLTLRAIEADDRFRDVALEWAQASKTYGVARSWENLLDLED